MKLNQVYTAEEAKMIDDHAISSGAEGYHLMQEAGTTAWIAIKKKWPQMQSIVVCCGPGNNGGDGWVVAKQAYDEEKTVFIVTTKTILTTDGQRAKNEALATIPKAQILDISEQTAIQALFDKIAPDTLIVDALFGVGLSRALQNPYIELVTLINAHQFPIIAIDIPSGINGTTGKSCGHHIQATLTITFIVEKRGLYRDQGKVAAGEIHLESLGLPTNQLTDSIAKAVYTDQIDASNFNFRSNHSHKGSFGTLLCVGGDEGMGGAIIIAAESAVRFGAGKVIVGSSTAHASIAVTRCPSIMSRSLDQRDLIQATIHQALREANTLVLGPGLGQSHWSMACFEACFTSEFSGPIVLDADALNLISTNAHAYTLVQNHPKNTMILTPHPKEAARLLQRIPHSLSSEMQQDPFEVAFALSEHFNCICLLKGHGTIIACNSTAYICSTGNAALAKAGQGDCLSGMIGALLAQGLEPFTAARQAAWGHGLAGEVWSLNQSELSLLPHETASIAAQAIQQNQYIQQPESSHDSAVSNS